MRDGCGKKARGGFRLRFGILTMSESLSIQAVGSTQTVAAANAASSRTATTATTAASTSATALPDLPNPSMHIDPQLGVVVLQFRSSSGLVTNTLPTQSQLDAYRAFGVPHAGDAKSDHLA